MRSKTVLVTVILAMVVAVGLVTPASAAKPKAEIVDIETVVFPQGDDCVVLGRTFTNDARWVDHTLTVSGVELNDLERIFGDGVVELQTTVAGGAGQVVNVFYTADAYRNSTAANPDDTDSVGPDAINCVVPEPEPYLDIYPFSQGRYWGAVAVAGEYEDPATLRGIWTVEGVDHDDPGTLDPEGGTVDFRYDVVPKKVSSISFSLYRLDSLLETHQVER